MPEDLKRKQLNLGECPKCEEWTHFNLIKKINSTKSIVECSFCLNKVKQFKNGKIYYEEILSHDMF